MFSKRLMALLLIALSLRNTNCQGAPWNYDPTSPYGPDNWKEYYPNCGGQSQSPIDVVTSGVQVDKSLTDFDYINYDNTNFGSFVLHNSGHDITVNILDSAMYLTRGGLQWNYKLAKFHFHCGREDAIGSEHLVDGKASALELHMVHWNSDLYSSFEEAAPLPYGLAVIGVFIEIGDENSNLNEEIGELSTYFEQIGVAGSSTTVPIFPIQAILPAARSYYRYEGSMTTPACWETVVLTVFKAPLYITSEQAARFRTASDGHGNLMDYNRRPTQKLNGRIVYTDSP